MKTKVFIIDDKVKPNGDTYDGGVLLYAGDILVWDASHYRNRPGVVSHDGVDYADFYFGVVKIIMEVMGLDEDIHIEQGEELFDHLANGDESKAIRITLDDDSAMTIKDMDYIGTWEKLFEEGKVE